MNKNKLFNKKNINFDDSLVNITVFGSGYGESIILYLPGLGWGVIDSCTAKVKKKVVNPALEFLKILEVKKLAFIILTHPHLDHYKGLSEIIEFYLGSIDRICYYAGEGLREYGLYLSRKSLVNEPGLKSLSYIFSTIKKAQRQGANVVKISERTQIIRKRDYQGHVIEMVALSPSEESVKAYCKLLYDYIPKDNFSTIKNVTDKDHNLVSTAIWCQIDGENFIFGSDLEFGRSDNSGWRGVLKNIDSPDLSTSFVKIPHHGSSNAYDDSVWSAFSNSVKPISVATPYSKTHAPLPDPKILDKIKKFSKDVYVTSKATTENPKKIYGDIPFENSYGIKAWSYIKQPQQIGYVNTSFSTNGKANHKITLKKPAFKY
jgi:hypothetical protein